MKSNWNKGLINTLGKERKVTELVGNLDKLMDVSEEVGFGAYEVFRPGLEEFKENNDFSELQEAIDHSDSLEKVDPMLSLVTISSTKKYKNKIKKLIEDTERIYDSFSSNQSLDETNEGSVQLIENSKNNIRSSLKNITTKLGKIKCMMPR